MILDNTKHGFVFRAEDDTIYLGIYENDKIDSFNEISDIEGIYSELLLEQVGVVEVSFEENDEISITDICTFTINNTNTGENISSPVELMLEDLEFPSEVIDNMFGSFINDAYTVH